MTKNGSECNFKNGSGSAKKIRNPDFKSRNRYTHTSSQLAKLGPLIRTPANPSTHTHTHFLLRDLLHAPTGVIFDKQNV